MNSPLEYSQIEINKTYYNLDGDNVCVISKSYGNYYQYKVVGTENTLCSTPYEMTELYNERPPQIFIDRYKAEKTEAKKIRQAEKVEMAKKLMQAKQMVPLCYECYKEGAWQSICLNCYIHKFNYDKILVTDIYYINLSWAGGVLCYSYE